MRYIGLLTLFEALFLTIAEVLDYTARDSLLLFVLLPLNRAVEFYYKEAFFGPEEILLRSLFFSKFASYLFCYATNF